MRYIRNQVVLQTEGWLLFAFLMAFQPAHGAVTLAPIHYWGDFGYEARIEDYNKAEDVYSNLVTLNVNASSYIWKPWFSRVSGGLGLTYSKKNYGNDGSNSNNIVTGNALISLLPQSRFPFEAHYRKTNSYVTGESLGSLPYDTILYGFSQRYGTRDGSGTVMGTYDHNTIKVKGYPDDNSDLYTLSLGKSFAANNLSLNARHEEASRRSTRINYRRNNIVARHDYRPGTSLTMQNMLTSVEIDDNTTGYSNKDQQIQFTSTTFWRPANKPYDSSMGLRYYSRELDQGELGGKGETLNAYGGLNYNISRYLRARGNITLNQSRVAGNTLTTDKELAGVSYSPAYLPLGKFQYNWFASGDLTNRNGGLDDGQNLTAQIGQNFTRNYPLGPGEEISTNYSQSLTGYYDTVFENTNRMTNGVSVGWRKGRAGKDIYIRLMLSDARSILGKRPDLYQMINFQLNSNYPVNQRSMLIGNVTVISTRNITEFNRGDGFATSASAGIMYRYINAFNVQNLHFLSELKIDEELKAARVVNRSTYNRKLWDNRLEYILGRLRMYLSLRMNDVNNYKYNILMFRINRTFGQ